MLNTPHSANAVLKMLRVQANTGSLHKMDSHARTSYPQNVIWLMLSTLIILIDQASKWGVRQLFQPYLPVKVLPFLNIQLAFNSGTAFGLFNNHTSVARWGLVAAALVIMGYLIICLLQTEPDKKMVLAALAFIIGGAVSNLLDRFSLGYVTDFIDFHIQQWHFATFNIADAAISVGAVCWVCILLLKRD